MRSLDGNRTMRRVLSGRGIEPLAASDRYVDGRSDTTAQHTNYARYQLGGGVG
jgi:hypothetical protein